MLGAGAEAQAYMKQYNQMALGIVLLHDDGRGRVRVGADGLPAIDYVVNPTDQAKLRKGLKALAKIYLAAGAHTVVLPHVANPKLTAADQVDAVVDGLDLGPNRLATFSAHQMSTMPMGADPQRAVTDPWGRLWAYQNLLVVDSSTFPTSLGVNPQITVAALADRAARHVLGEPARFPRSSP
jgi:choline dehydrogenase-like flavoprotein